MDTILKQAESIQRIASKEMRHLDYDDLAEIWKLAEAIRITRTQQINEAAFLATCEPMQGPEVEVMEFPV